MPLLKTTSNGRRTKNIKSGLNQNYKRLKWRRTYNGRWPKKYEKFNISATTEPIFLKFLTEAQQDQTKIRNALNEDDLQRKSWTSQRLLIRSSSYIKLYDLWVFRRTLMENSKEISSLALLSPAWSTILFKSYSSKS